MPKLSFKKLVLTGIVFVVGAIASGYFYGVGQELWQITSGQQFMPSFNSPFWFVSVPLGIVGVILLILAVSRTRTSNKLDEMEKTLATVVTERDSKFQDRVNKYVLAVAEAENLLGVSHKDFFVNSEIMNNQERDSAHLTDLAFKLLVIVKQNKEKMAVEPLKETTLDVFVTSTTDWFEIGIENGQLRMPIETKIISGAVENSVPNANYLYVNHSKSPRLQMRIKATFLLPRKNAICVLRKGDAGHLAVSISAGIWIVWPSLPAVSLTPDTWTYKENPTKPKNELTFSLRKISWWPSF